MLRGATNFVVCEIAPGSEKFLKTLHDGKLWIIFFNEKAAESQHIGLSLKSLDIFLGIRDFKSRFSFYSVMEEIVRYILL